MTQDSKLPDGWQTVKFGDIVRNVREAERDPLVAGLERYVGLEHIEPENLHIKEWGLIEEGTSFTQKFVKGQVLFGKRRAYQRKVAVAEFDGFCSGDILVFEPKDDRLLPELLPFIVQSEGFFTNALRTSSGSLSPRTRWRDLAAYEFLLPPLNEQRRIAEILWAAEELWQKQETLLKQFWAFRQSTIDHLFPDPPTVTDSVLVVTLRDVCEMQNGRAFPSKDYCNEGIKLLRPGNLGIDGYIDWQEDVTKLLPDKYLEIASDYVVNPGDVVINLTAQSLEDGFMGRVCIARQGDRSLLNQRIGLFKCTKKILPDYLYRYLQTSRFRRLVESRCEGSKIKHLYWRHFEDFAILYPSIEQQGKAIRQIAAIDAAIESTKAHLEESSTLRHALRENLLSPDESGNLDRR